VALAGAASITVVNRGAGRGAELVELVNTKTPARSDLVVWDHAYRIPDTADIVVNATSIGLFPDIEARLDLDIDTIRPGLIVADVIPNPPRTRLIRDAEARGCVVLDGLGMLVNQGVISVRHWTGFDVDGCIMRQKLAELFQEE
jgi:shikimate dehydrogenase